MPKNYADIDDPSSGMFSDSGSSYSSEAEDNNSGAEDNNSGSEDNNSGAEDNNSGAEDNKFEAENNNVVKDASGAEDNNEAEDSHLNLDSLGLTANNGQLQNLCDDDEQAENVSSTQGFVVEAGEADVHKDCASIREEDQGTKEKEVTADEEKEEAPAAEKEEEEEEDDLSTEKVEAEGSGMKEEHEERQGCPSTTPKSSQSIFGSTLDDMFAMSSDEDCEDGETVQKEASDDDFLASMF